MMDPDASGSAFFLPFDTCPGCRAAGLRVIGAGDQAYFSCLACDSCWHVDLGWVHRVEPAGSPDSPCLRGRRDDYADI